MNIEILLDPWIDLQTLLVGMFLGHLLRRLGHRLIGKHAFWMIAGGAIFFVPIMFHNVYHDVLFSTRTLGIFGLWMIFAGGMWIGTRLTGPGGRR